MVPPDRELDTLRFLDRLSGHLRGVQDPQHALRYVLREAREFLEADRGCVAVARDRLSSAQVIFGLPTSGDWDLELLARFIHVERPVRPADMAVVPITRRGRGWAALALVRELRAALDSVGKAA